MFILRTKLLIYKMCLEWCLAYNNNSYIKKHIYTHTIINTIIIAITTTVESIGTAHCH